MRRIPPVLPLLLAAALILAGCGELGPVGNSGPGSNGTTSTGAAQPPGTSTPGTVTPNATTTPGESPFTAPADKVKQVVVNVGIQGRIQGMPGTTDVGNGSGIVIRSDGYILTNDHVVEGSDGVTAVIASQTLPATIVGKDPATDLAVIKVAKTGLAAATIGNPKDLTVGDYCIAVGYPFGIGQTVTHGIISAVGRNALGPLDQSTPASTSISAYTDLVQTDAAINPGNSGGALAALDGSIIGVNTLIESPSGTSAGIGFAIPIDFAMRIADQLIKTGKALHPLLGVGIVSLTPHVSQQLGVEATQGVLVQQVKPGSGAARGGVKKGDVIVEMAGKPVTEAGDVYAILRQQQIGSTIPVVVIRGKQRVSLQVPVGSG